MNTTEMMLAYLGTWAVVGLVWYVLLAVANWKIFTKANEAGWKSIVPVLNMHVSYKIAWHAVWFWMTVLASFVLALCGGLYNSSQDVIWVYVGMFCGLISLIITCVHSFKLAKVFGHGFGFALGLIFLNPIFMLILGFGPSRYVREDY